MGGERVEREERGPDGEGEGGRRVTVEGWTVAVRVAPRTPPDGRELMERRAASSSALREAAVRGEKWTEVWREKVGGKRLRGGGRGGRSQGGRHCLCQEVG